MNWKNLSIALPAMLVGGVVFGSAFGRADSGRGDLTGAWPSTGGVLVAERDRARPPKAPHPPKAPPAPVSPYDDDDDADEDAPTPPVPPAPPAPPAPPPAAVPGVGGGISVSIHGDRIDISGVGSMVRQQIQGARDGIRNNPSIPPQLRDKVMRHLDKVQGKLDRKLSNLKISDLDEIGHEMDEFGRELEDEMRDLEDDLKHLDSDIAKKFGKDFTDKFKVKLKWDKHGPNVDVDDDDDDDDEDDDDDVTSVSVPDPDDDADVAAALPNLDDLQLKPAQREAIAKLGAESDRTVAGARQRLEALSQQLEKTLAKTAANEAEVTSLIDQITAQEAAIRKARIIGWVKTRQLLDDQQRAKVERKKHH